MADNTNTNAPVHDDKRQKTEEDAEMFQSVGDHATNVDSQGLRQTGAEDAEGHPVQEIESFCVNCEKTGVTRLLLTRIPYFREIVLMSFECPHCHLKNSEIQPAAQVSEKGSKYMLRVDNKEDLARQVVKSDSGAVKFVELDVEIPAKRGQLTNVEGLLTQLAEDLESDQPVRQHVDPETHKKIEEFLAKIRGTIDGDEQRYPFTVQVDDPAGNSWIEYVPGEPSSKWSHVEYFRTKAMAKALGLSVQEDDTPARNQSVAQAVNEAAPTITAASDTVATNDGSEIENMHSEVQTFQSSCPSCFSNNCPTNMKVVNIPHFKDVIIMATVCEDCGYKSNEVKTGGEVPEKGKRTTLLCDDPEDLTRDILKSESCRLHIPELDLDLTAGTLGGRFTTIEGLLNQVHDELDERVFTQTSDSMTVETEQRWKTFLARLKSASEGKIPFTLVMEDPLAASYIQNPFAPDADPNMNHEDFERTDEQNDDLGLKDMNVDSYQEQPKEEAN